MALFENNTRIRLVLTNSSRSATVPQVTVATLRSCGVRPADHVAIVLPNGPEMATTFLAVASAATAAPLNPAYRAQEFEFYLADLDPSAVIVQKNVTVHGVWPWTAVPNLNPNLNLLVDWVRPCYLFSRA